MQHRWSYLSLLVHEHDLLPRPPHQPTARRRHRLRLLLLVIVLLRRCHRRLHLLLEAGQLVTLGGEGLDRLAALLQLLAEHTHLLAAALVGGGLTRGGGEGGVLGLPLRAFLLQRLDTALRFVGRRGRSGLASLRLEW